MDLSDSDLLQWCSPDGAAPNFASKLSERLRRTWGAVPTAAIRKADVPARVRGSVSGPYLTIAGEIGPLTMPSVAIVGTRRITAPLASRLRRLVTDIVRATGAAVVSGGAIGVDAIAQEVALELEVPALVVIAGGLCYPSPASHRRVFVDVASRGGAVLSDRPPMMNPQRHDFVRRNRLIAALADVVVVAAAPFDSGALATASYARRLGRPVLAVPGAFDDPLYEGCHELLRSGALPCTRPDDLEACLGRQPSLPLTDAARPAAAAVVNTADLSEGARVVLETLSAGAVGVDGVARVSGIAVQAVQTAMLELELAGALR